MFFTELLKLQLSQMDVTFNLQIGDGNFGDRLNPGDLLRVEVRQTDGLNQTFLNQFFHRLAVILENKTGILIPDMQFRLYYS